MERENRPGVQTNFYNPIGTARLLVAVRIGVIQRFIFALAK
jgi:hypothetical protein